MLVSFAFFAVGGFSLFVWLSICVVVFFELWTATCQRVFCQEWEATLQLMTVGWSSSSGLQMQLLNIGRNTLLLIRDTQDFLACRSFLTAFPDTEKIILTRMHSSRMRTIRRSGCRGVYLSMHWAGGAGCVYPSMHWAGGCLPRGGVCLSACWDTHTPVNRMTDRHLWKYYLAATTSRTVINTVHVCIKFSVASCPDIDSW